MSLHLHRSQRVEELVAGLAASLRALKSADPFETVPVIIGSRGMDRWLRHELATLNGACANLAFVFPRNAFERATCWVLGVPEPGDRSPFWAATGAPERSWSGPRLTAGVVAAIRSHRGSPAFARVSAYLKELGPEVDAREMTFAMEVTATVERLTYDRPADACAWSRAPASAGSHAWLGQILSDLTTRFGPSDAGRLDALEHAAATNTGRPLFIFGLSTLRPGDKLRIAALAKHLDVHLFALTPSSVWWDHIKRRSQARSELTHAATQGDPEKLAELLRDLQKANGMLAANGAPSRDLQVWLESVGYEEPEASRELPRAGRVLCRLQEWVDRADDNPTRPEELWEVPPGDSSLELHACHGPLRQCEALRDALLQRFADDDTLEPRHVLVMMPDIATYAPMLAAVFARAGDGVPAIPLHLADLGLTATNPVAQVLLSVLQLTDERMTASRLLELLQLAPLRARFHIAADDLPDLREMIVGSGMRWGWNAADRARHDQPRLDQNTLRFGLERLALGVLTHDDGGTAVVHGTPASGLSPAVPFELATRDRIARFGKLAKLCDELEQAARALAVSDTQAGWRVRIDALIERFVAIDDATAAQRQQVSDTLSDRLSDDDADTQPLSRAAVLSLLQGAFELPRHGDRPTSGAVIACALEPMRSVPFRVIAMLGLDDKAFPRPATLAAWDPFASRKYGEDDRRTVDRHLLLEALLCARDALLLFGTGFETKRGKPAPMSVVISELAEIVAGATGRSAESLIVRHTLQPWSRQRFEHEGTRPIDAVWAEAANALAQVPEISGAAGGQSDAPWPEDEEPITDLSPEALAAALATPQRELLGGRLGLRLDPRQSELCDREPLEASTMSGWTQRDKALQQLRAGPDGRDQTNGRADFVAGSSGTDLDIRAFADRLRGEGQLPLSAKGQQSVDDVIARATAAFAAYKSVPGETVKVPSSYKYTSGGLTLSFAPSDLRVCAEGSRLVWLTPSVAANSKLELTAWISLLVAIAGGATVTEAVVVSCPKADETEQLVLAAPDDADTAMAHLRTLIELRNELRSAPVMLFPNLSRALVDELAKPDHEGDAESALRAVESFWEGGTHAEGDRPNPWVAALFGHLDIEDLCADADRIAALAARVWTPVREARAKAKANAKANAKASA